MIDKERQWYREADAAALEELQASGVQITFPELDAFREAAHQVHREWADRVGGMNLIERIRSFPYEKGTGNHNPDNH